MRRGLRSTTAEDGVGDARSRGLGGALFRVDVGNTGLRPRLFKLM